ncbi:hypothetical protein COCON_G00233870 [Conger conger]|uniref:Ig-like domain-containing protein n=1 Tax=Conger conger TaxID=82655 RepID=A0A9Q1CUC6_CONCO|nr:hypothetical protein COCON_G00233870 [Conger conger]
MDGLHCRCFNSDSRTWDLHVLVGLLLALLSASPSASESVSVGHSVNLPCSGAPDRDVEWHFKQHMHSDWLLVAKLHTGRISPGPGFQGRVESIYEEQPGNYSLVLSPAVYNDQGSYECQYKGPLHRNTLNDVKLVILDPVSVSIAVGMSVSLPCYGGISKQARAVDLDILWKRDGKMVFQLYNNTITYGSGFESRASVSPEQALRHPLQIRTVKAGEELSIQLPTTDPVRVTFTGPGLDEVLMVDAHKGTGEHCGQRCELLGQEKTFLLRRVTLEDAGVYTVTDSETSRIISNISLQISGLPPSAGETTRVVPWILLFFSILGNIGLAVWMYCNKRREAELRIAFQPAAVEDPSGSRTELQQPGVLDVPEPNLPVSETGPSDQTEVQEKKSEEVQGTRPW